MRRAAVTVVALVLLFAGLIMADLDLVGFYEKPLVKFERLLETYLAFAPRGYRSFAMALPPGYEAQVRPRSDTRVE